MLPVKPLNEPVKDPKLAEGSVGLDMFVLLAKIAATSDALKSEAAVKVNDPMVALSPAFNLCKVTVC